MTPLHLLSVLRRFVYAILVGLLVLIHSPAHSAADAAPPEPGPENGGLRIRFTVTPAADAGKEGYDMRLDVLNVSKEPITLRAGWTREDEHRDLKGYIEASTGIETYPAIAPWIGGVMQGQRTAPQPEQALKAGEVLTVQWHTAGRRLKNGVTNPNEVQNPTFPTPGLYSVHAKVVIITPQRNVLLRSNEVLVPVGGSREMPKHTFGHLLNADEQAKTGVLGLGALHLIEIGDHFRVAGGGFKGNHWRMTITHVQPEYSVGQLEPEPLPPEFKPREQFFPKQHSSATLLTER